MSYGVVFQDEGTVGVGAPGVDHGEDGKETLS